MLNLGVKFSYMATRFFLGFMMLFLSQSIFAQRVLKNNTNRAPLSDKMSNSISGADSLEVHLINYDVPGLEIVSCKNCEVMAKWINGKGELEVVVRNNSTTKSKTATVWVHYWCWKPAYVSSGLKQVAFSERKAVPVLNPGQTINIKFLIQFGYEAQAKSKLVKVSLTQHSDPERIQ
jgi:hypothetical protein